MKSKEEFKNFVKNHPELINYVKNNDMTWQKFYELYSLYDEDDNIWEAYLKNEEYNKINSINNKESTKIKDIPGINDIFNLIKNIKPETIQENISSIQKFLGFISDFISDSSSESKNGTQRNIYTPRPTHKMFED